MPTREEARPGTSGATSSSDSLLPLQQDDSDIEDSDSESERKAYITWREELSQALADEGSLSYLIEDKEKKITKEEPAEIVLWMQTQEKSTEAYVCLAETVAAAHELGRKLDEDELIEISFQTKDSDAQSAVIVEMFDILTTEARITHKTEVRKGKADLAATCG